MGSSDTAAVLGLYPNAWMTPGDVYLSKTEEIEPADLAQFRRGNLLEEPVIQWAEQELGKRFRRNQFRVHSAGLLASHIDGLGDHEAVEAKTSAMPEAWGAEGTDQIPDYIQAQCQHHCQVAGLDRVWVPVLFSNFAFQMYRVERDDELGRIIVDEVTTFWQRHVLERVPPDSMPTIQFLKRRKREPESIVTLDRDTDAVVAEYLGLQERRKKVQGFEDEAKAAIINALEDAEAGTLPDGRTVTFLEQARKTIDARGLRLAHPEIADAFTKETTYRVLRIKESKEATT